MTVKQYMRAIAIEAFRQAARQFTAIILVRRLNPASLPYIGKPGYIPKSIYCKAKTAKSDAFAPQSGRMAHVAGLVVDPTLPGLERAFPRPEDLANTRHSWKKFLQTLGVSGLTREYLYHRLPVERGGFYLVQHGSQKHLGHTDEAPDVFWPDGRITELDGISAVTRLYEKEFGGRKV